MTSEALLPADHPARATESPRPSPITAISDAAIARLKTRLPGRVKVEAFPDKPEEYDFEGYDAAALVLYDGSRFDAAGPVGEQGLRETQRLAVALLVRSLLGEGGAYRLIHETRVALHGVSLAGSTALRPLEAALDRADAGVWQYRLVFEAAVVAVPSSSAPGVVLPRAFLSDRR